MGDLCFTPTPQDALSIVGISPMVLLATGICFSGHTGASFRTTKPNMISGKLCKNAGRDSRNWQEKLAGKNHSINHCVRTASQQTSKKVKMK